MGAPALDLFGARVQLVVTAAISHRSPSRASRARADPPVPGLVAAYAFDEGAGARRPRRLGQRALRDDLGRHLGERALRVARSPSTATTPPSLLGSLGTFYQSGFTLEAWVQKTSASENDAAVVGTWTGERADDLGRPHRHPLPPDPRRLLLELPRLRREPVAGQWQHLAATYDGTTARFYIDGVEVASRAVSGSVGSSDMWRVGAYGGSREASSTG